jgi:hypothetical protein
MPCPYFEPRQAVPQRTLPNARLPLIDEFDGVCRALLEPRAIEADQRLRLCNHGNVRGHCSHFPTEEKRSAFRFEVLRRSIAHLDLLFIEESNYTPLAWHRLAFTIDPEQLEPDPPDPCQRAQVLAFCRSYLRRYPA